MSFTPPDDVLAAIPPHCTTLASPDGESWFAVWSAPGASVDLIVNIHMLLNETADRIVSDDPPDSFDNWGFGA